VELSGGMSGRKCLGEMSYTRHVVLIICVIYDSELAVDQGVQELNKTTALYIGVARDLGSNVDSELLRSQLACIRKRALVLAKQNKVNILPYLRRSVW